MKKIKNFTLILILLITIVQIGVTQLPNDVCSGATPILLNEEGISDSININLEFAHPSLQGANECLISHDVDRWYSFVAKGAITQLFSIDPRNIGLSVYDGECGYATHIACDYEIGFPTIVGKKYLIRAMRAYRDASAGSPDINHAPAYLKIQIRSHAADTNIDCSSAKLLPLSDSVVEIAGNFTDSGFTSMCDTPSEDIWYKFVAPASGSVNIEDTNNNSIYGEVYSNNCSSLNLIECMNSYKNIFGLSPGNTYYLRVSKNVYLSGFTIKESTVVEAPNVLCENATLVNVGGPAIDGDDRSSTTGYLWYRFTAPASGDVEYNMTVNYRCATFLDDCSNPEYLLLSQSKSGAPPKVFGLTPGADYLVRIDLRESQFTFGISEIFDNGASNNFCSDREFIKVNANTVVTGTFSAANPTGRCSTLSDLWYEFIAPVSGHVDVNHISGNQFSYVWLEPNCGTYERIAGHNMVPGNTYILKITKYLHGDPFSFSLSAGASIAKLNQTCQDAAKVITGTQFSYLGADDQSKHNPISECGLKDGDLWYYFTATSNSVELSTSSDNGLTYEMYSGSCGSLSEIELRNGIATGLTINETYYLRLFSNIHVNYDITITDLPLDENDECSNAQIIQSNGTYGMISYTLSAEAIPSCIDQTEPLLDSWYKFTASTSSISVDGTSDFVLYSNICGSLQEVGCLTGDIRQIDNLNIGIEYHLRELAQVGNIHEFYFQELEVAANAFCEGSIDIQIWENTYQETTSLDFRNGGAVDPSNSCGGIYEKWFNLTGPTDGGIRMITNLHPLNSSMFFIEILDDCDGAQVYCQELIINKETETIFLVPGEDYKLRISSTTNNNTGNDNIDYNINIRSIPATPVESDCANAVPFAGPYDSECDDILSGNTNNAQKSIGAFCGRNSANAVFYSITPDDDSNYRFEISNSAASHQVSVFADCSLNTPIACGLSSVDALLVNGTPYIIAVYPQTEGVTSSFDICVYKPEIVNDGSVGINTTNPQAKLDVNGGIRPGFTTNAIPGNIRWNTDLEVFDGTTWKSTTVWDHQASQDINMVGHRVSNLATPVLPTDAVTKAYVDGFSDTDNSPSNELQILSLSGNDVTLSNGGGTITLNPDDADADPNNEIQTIYISNGNLTLSHNGGSVSNNDADADPNNEIQTISVSNDNLTLSHNGGSISINDADADPNNEIQVMSRTSNSPNIELSNGGGSVNIEDGDSDDANEFQTITRVGSNLILSDDGGFVSINDNDYDAYNEIQYMVKAGSVISLTDGGQVYLSDDDAQNEIQTLSRSGDNLYLSQSTPFVSIQDADSDSLNEIQRIYRIGDLVIMTGVTPTSGGSFSIIDDDGDAQNEIQTLTRSGNDLYLSQSTPFVSIQDDDSDPLNEIQTINRVGDVIHMTSGGSVSIIDDDGDDQNELITTAKLVDKTLSIVEAGENHNVELGSIASKWDINGSMVYNNTNNIGIGTSIPEMKLDVRGTIQTKVGSGESSPQLMLVETNSDKSAKINFENSVETNNRWALHARADNTLEFNSFNLNHTVGGNILQVRGNGDVGINGIPTTELHLFHGDNGSNDGMKIENIGTTTTPWWRIYVSSGSSDLRLFSKSQGNSIIGKFNDVTGAYTNPSDRRMKESIQDLHFDWDSFMDLGAYSYTFKGVENDKRSIGLMAQDVIEVYPELVDYVEDTDQYLMNYSGLGVVAIKAVQEQQKEIKALKSENEAMKKELQDIKILLENIQK